MNSTHFEELINYFNTKIQTIYSLIPLSQLYEDLSDKNQWNRNAVLDSNQYNHNNSDDYSKRLSNKKPDLKEISQMVIEMKAMTEEIKLLLRQQKQTIISESIDYHNDLDVMQRHCDHINRNIPEFLHNNKTVNKKSGFVKRPVIEPQNGVQRLNAKTNPRPKATAVPDFNSRSTQEIKFGAKSGRKKVVRKDIENIATVSFITTEEFDSIPHYILGRMTYEMMNRAIADFNRTIGAKYKLVANYCNKYSDEEMRKCVKYKEQENSETEGQYFCTIADLKELSDLKSEPTIRKVVTCLRHCKRVREIRGNPPKLVRYAIITNQMTFN